MLIISLTGRWYKESEEQRSKGHRLCSPVKELKLKIPNKTKMFLQLQYLKNDSVAIILLSSDLCRIFCSGPVSHCKFDACFFLQNWPTNTHVVHTYADIICIWQSTVFCCRRPSTQECESLMLMFLNT